MMNHLIKGISNVSLKCVSQNTVKSSTSLFYIPSITCLTGKCYSNKSTTILNSTVNKNNYNNNSRQQSTSTNIFSQALKETKVQEKEQKEETQQDVVFDDKNKTVRVSIKGAGYSQWKLMALFKALKGLNHREAIAQLSFTEKQPSKKVRGLIKHAAHVAESVKGMDPERLIVNQIWLGRSVYKNSIMWKGRGQASVIRRPFCHIFVEIKETTFKEGEKKVGKFGKTHKTFAKYDGSFDHNKKY
ncbi:hypothetical protein RB653_004133 [Dictyostelium firmibasis]|uniref:MRP-L22 n=1 Tax=Dictyostelium firmibasis TaxID=79012 RepID=A0AAN7U5P2_9MYCE